MNVSYKKYYLSSHNTGTSLICFLIKKEHIDFHMNLLYYIFLSSISWKALLNKVTDNWELLRSKIKSQPSL